MDNFYITRWFDWAFPGTSSRVEVINRLLHKLGCWVSLQAPRHSGAMTNVEQRMNLWHFISQVLAYGVEGDLVELGCNQGQSSVLIQKVIDEHDAARQFHVYDSFEGLPTVRAEDGATPFVAGQLKTMPELLLANFARYGLRPPILHKGWFDATLPSELPDKICFAYLDGDLYDSILISLRYVYPRLSRGAVCVIDDYADPSVWAAAWNKLPGVKRACDEFFADKPEKVSFIYSADMSHGYFRKI